MDTMDWTLQDNKQSQNSTAVCNQTRSTWHGPVTNRVNRLQESVDTSLCNKNPNKFKKKLK